MSGSSIRRPLIVRRIFLKYGVPASLLVGIFLSCIHLACDPVHSRPAVDAPDSAGDIEVNIEALKASMARLCADSSAILRLRSRYRFADTLRNFYRQRSYHPLWTQDGLESNRCMGITHFLSTASDHGLDPDMFRYSQIQQLMNDTRQKAARGSLTTFDLLAELEIALSSAVVDYARALRYGLLNIREIDPNDYTIPVRAAKGVALFSPLRAENIEEYLDSIQPRSERYLKLMQALKFYESIARKGGWEQVPVEDIQAKRDDVVGFLPQVANRLVTTGQLTWLRFLSRQVVNLIPDASTIPPDSYMLNWQKINANVYDTTLCTLVREYQSQNGLAVDGQITKRFLQHINVPVQERINQIKVTMDRFRWFEYPDTGRYIRVNIPEFYLYAFDEHRPPLKIKVCTGMRYSVRIKGQPPMSYQTPMMRGKLSSLVLNPTWSVPPSIAKRETYYQALKNPKYLARNGYKVYRNDSLVDPSTIDWKTYKADNLPFRFVQRPGEGNALGKIKFIFDNPFDIYLHDTPKRRPFSYASRTVSHGCIRLEKPLELARFLFEGHSTWTAADVQEYTSTTSVTKYVMLENKLTIWVDYFTAWVDEEGIIQLRDDVYSKDAKLKKAMLAYRSF